MIPSSSIPLQISPGVKRTYSESTALPNLPGITSGSGVKRACNESIVSPNSPIVSSGSGLKRAHEKSSANDDEEQPDTRARISTLIAGLHGVDAAEDDEICNGTLRLIRVRKMVIEAKRKEMERFKRMKVYRVVTRESVKRDEEKWSASNGSSQTKEQKSI